MSPLSPASCPLVNAPASTVAKHTVCGGFMRQTERRGSHLLANTARTAKQEQAGSDTNGTLTNWSPKTYRHISDQGNLIPTV